MADAMKTRGQDVQQEAAHELPDLQGHGLVPGVAVFAIIFPAEGDAAFV